MRKWILTACLLSVSLLAGCSGSAGRALQEGETVNLFAEVNRLYDQLEANTPIEVAPANASAQTWVVTIPSLF